MPIDYSLLAQNIPNGQSTPSAVGSPGGISDLMNNNLLWSYLSQAGAALAGPKSVAAAINPITQNVIGAQSKTKMQNNYLSQLTDMLKGQDGAKMTISKDGINHTISPAALNNPDTNSMALLQALHATEGNPVGQSNSGIPQQQNYQMLSQLLNSKNPQQQEGGDQVVQPETGGTPSSDGTFTGAYNISPDSLPALRQFLAEGQSPEVTRQLMRQLLNPPSSQLSISNADLAGLTSSDVSQALHDTLGVEGARQRSIMNANELNKTLFEMTKAGKPDPEGLIYPVPVPGIGQVTARQWKELPTDQKSYAAYVYQQGKINPNEPVVSFKEYQKFGKEVHTDMLKALMDDPQLMNTELALRRAGATSISLGPAERAIEQGKGAGIAEVQSPDFMTKVKEHAIKDSQAWYDPPREVLAEYTAKAGGDRAKGMALYHEKVLRDTADKQIRQAYSNMGIKVKFGKLGDGPVGWYTEDGKLIRSAQ